MEEIKKLFGEAKLTGRTEEEAWTSALKTLAHKQERDARQKQRECEKFPTVQDDKKRENE